MYSKVKLHEEIVYLVSKEEISVPADMAMLRIEIAPMGKTITTKFR